MLVTEVMTRGTECVRFTDSLQQAADKMKSLDVGPLPVCGDNDRLVGMVSEQEITVRAIVESCGPRSKTVKDVMTPDVVYCFENQDVMEAARLMKDHHIRQLGVLNRDNRLVGIVSLGDLPGGWR